MFVGPGGVGKSSLLHGLMNKPLTEANSTQLADIMTVKEDNLIKSASAAFSTQPTETVTEKTDKTDSVIKPATTSWAMASENSLCWQEITDKDEIMELVGLLHLVTKASSGESNSRFVDLLEGGTTTDFKSISIGSLSRDGHRTSGDVVQEVVYDILLKAKENPSAKAPETEVLIRLWDCGGQSVFLDVLPAFLTPRTMFLLMYDARRSLTDKCLIRSFRCGIVVDEQEHSATSLELLLEWMASIHAMLGSVPRIVPVATHGDHPDCKAEIVNQLTRECEGMAFSHLLLPGIIVDNTKAGLGENEDPGFSFIRKEVHKFASKELEVPTPVAWVLFRRVFQKIAKQSNSPIVRYQTVKDIAAACKIPKIAISSVITFYHELAVFFHYAEVPGLKDYVIADPQWLVGQFTKVLGLEGFEDFPNREMWRHLREKGILVEPLYQQVWKNSRSEIQPQFIADLLVHFLLAAPINEISKITNVDGKEYFMSCVLPALTSEERKDRHKVKQAAPLHLLFNTHYVPPGFFSRLVTTLVNNKNFRVAFDKGMYRDRITLFYGKAHCEIDEVTLTKYSSSIEIDVVRMKNRPPCYLPFSVVCREILDFITDSFPTILNWLKGIEVYHAFICHCDIEDEISTKQHYIRIPYTFTMDTVVRCDKEKFPNLTTSHRFWLKLPKDKSSTTPPLKEFELQQVGDIIQSRGMVKQLADSLEMTNPCDGHEILKAWSEEMKEYSSDLRTHLSYHLITLGIDDVANRLYRNRPLVHAQFIQQMGAITHPPIVVPHIVSDKLSQALDFESGGVPKHLGQIADSMGEWEGRVLDELGLSDADVADISLKCSGEGSKARWRKALMLWKQRLGNRATYKELIATFRRADHQDYADTVSKIFESKNDSSVIPAPGPQSITMVQNQEYTQESSPKCVAAPCHMDPSMGNDTTSLSLSADTVAGQIDTVAGQIETAMETKHKSQLQDEVDKQPFLVPQAFSKTIEELSLWLSNHPDIGPGYQEDVDILKGARVNGRAFLKLNESILKELKVSVGFRMIVLDVIDELVAALKI